MARDYKYRSIKICVNHQSTVALEEQINNKVCKFCWTSARAVHDTALIDRGVDVSVYDGESISIKEHMVLNEDLNKLFLV